MNTNFSPSIETNVSETFTFRKLQKLARAACFAIAGMVLLMGTQAQAHTDQRSIDRAASFLNGKNRDQEIIGCMHFGETFVSKKYYGCEETTGGFGIAYTYNWTDDGVTTVEFYFDNSGNFKDLSVISSNGVVQAPFLVANGTITLVGQAILDAEKDQLSESDRNNFQRCIDNADAKGLLIAELALDQVFGS